MYKSILFFLLLFFGTIGKSQTITPKEYIQRYKDVAIKEMELYGIPASITLAQACLESNFGNSYLSRVANNHFGIKCHSSWTGKKVYQDDDKKHECFRHYSSAWQSFRDHSKFLKNGRRYQFLFNYSPTDYKKWAHGLKKAGYATASSYPKRLITIIERYKLYQYDQMTSADALADNNNKPTKKVKKNHKRKTHRKRKDDESFSFNPFGRTINTNNRVKYITAKKGDSFYKIAEELEMMRWQLYKYNELPKSAEPVPGKRYYIQPKRSRATRGIETYTVKQGETLHDIAQHFAMKSRSILRKNNLKNANDIKPGMTLWLRRRKPRD